MVHAGSHDIHNAAELLAFSKTSESVRHSHRILAIRDVLREAAQKCQLALQNPRQQADIFGYASILRDQFLHFAHGMQHGSMILAAELTADFR